MIGLDARIPVSEAVGDGDVRGAVIRQDDRYLRRLPRHDRSVVGERVERDAVGEERRLLELALLLAESEVDIELRCLVYRQAAKRAPQHADGEQAVEERLDRRLIVDRGEILLRRQHRQTAGPRSR